MYRSTNHVPNVIGKMSKNQVGYHCRMLWMWKIKSDSRPTYSTQCSLCSHTLGAGPVFIHPKPLSEIHSRGCTGPYGDQPLTATDQGQGGQYVNG